MAVRAPHRSKAAIPLSTITGHSVSLNSALMRRDDGSSRALSTISVNLRYSEPAVRSAARLVADMPYSFQVAAWVLLRHPRRMSVFISYAREDEAAAHELYLALTAAGLDPWMDKPPGRYRSLGLLPGENWRQRLEVEIRKASRMILLLSETAIAKVGFVQNEFRLALEVMNSMPAGARFAVPLLIENCRPPPLVVGAIALADLNWIVLSEVGIPLFVEMLKADMSI